jgi:Flp pilus assembly protein CpaB
MPGTMPTLRVRGRRARGVRRRIRSRGRAWRLRRMARHPAVFWLLAVAVAAATTLTVSNHLESAEAARRQWGTSRPVVVVVDDIAAGERIRAGAVEIQSRPTAMVPEGAMSEDPAGRVASVALHAGEILLAPRVAPSGVTGVAAVLPLGTRALAVPAGPGTPPLEPGNRVDVLATFGAPDPYTGEAHTSGAAEPTFIVATAAMVVMVTEEAVTLAVSGEEAPRLAFALTVGVVTLALVGADW